MFWLFIWQLSLATLCSSSESFLLKTSTSFVKLENPQWLLQGEELLLSLKIHPQTLNGNVLFVYGSDTETNGVLYELSISLSQGHLLVDLKNGNGEKILNKPFTTTHMNTTEEHSLYLKMNSKEKTVQYKLDNDKEVVSEISKELNMNGTQIMVEIGCNENSIMGCVMIERVETGREYKEEETQRKEEKDVGECLPQQTCGDRDCGEGKCLALEVPTCDCFSTGKAGPNCKDAAHTVSVDAESDQGVWYVPLARDQRPTRIAWEFKFNSEEDEGVLLFANLSSGSPIKLYVVEKKGKLIFSDYGNVNFTLEQTNGFHSIRLDLYLDDGLLNLHVDGITQKMGWEQTDTEIRFLNLVFGQSAHESEANDIGFTGCLRNIYVDHLDILERLYLLDPRVASDKSLQPCHTLQPKPIILGADMLHVVAPPTLDETLPIPTKQEESIIDFDEKLLGKADLFPEPAHSKKPVKTFTECERAIQYQCKHGSICQKTGAQFSCVCKEGYTGTFCQFSVFPRSCSHSHLFHHQLNGPTRIDIDGSGPLDVSIVQCDNELTTIPNDMPNNTVVRDSSDPSHALFVISYRDFSQPKLQSLISQSLHCEQNVHYDCNTAPLRFSTSRTWFHVASFNRSISQIGAIPTKCECAQEKKGCTSEANCNCDSRGITSDSGSLRGIDSGITRIVSLHNSGDVRGMMTIGPLKCQGFGGSESLRFSSPSSLRTVLWKGNELSFQFRTGDSFATLVTVQEDAEHELRIQLTTGYRVTAIWRHGDEHVNLDVEPQYKLNDTNWHQIIVEVIDDQLRMTVDSTTKYIDVKGEKIPRDVLILGDENALREGFVGCIRSLFVNNEVVDLHKHANGGTDKVHIGCEDKCSTEHCQNNAQCVEDFATNSALCICKYPMIHSGANCEIDINKDSSVSFHGGFLKYEKLHTDPLMDQIVFSARTDQPKALLFFAHDHENNFLQIHLSDEVNVTLTLNNQDQVHSCTVTARQGDEFSDMEWIQIVVEHRLEESSLTINEEQCTIRAKRELAKVPITQFHNVTSEFVTIPVGLQSPNDPQPFKFIFIGGVERDTHSRSGEKRLLPVYQSTIPDLLGCARGLRIGSSRIDLRHTTNGYRPEDPSLVRIGCDMRCGSLNCHHSGHCSVGWLNYDPTSPKTTCDCSRTSYAGASCTLDEGIRFDGKTILKFDVGQIVSRYIVDGASKYPQLFKFAFSAQPKEQPDRQNLAIIYFRDQSRFEVNIHRNGSLHIGVVVAERGLIMVKNFKGNFTDGFRHFIVAEFRKDQATAVMVDSVRHDFEYMDARGNLDLFDAVNTVFGGGDDIVETGRPGDFYMGCMSNILLDYQKGPLYLTPIGYLGNDGHSNSKMVELHPAQEIHKVGCAQFANPDVLPVHQNTVKFPVWETNFARRVYHGPVTEEDGNNDKDFLPIPLFLLIIIILAVLLIIALLIICCCCCCKKTKEQEKPRPDEEMPLRPIVPDYIPTPYSPTNQKARNNYDIPAADTELDRPIEKESFDESEEETEFDGDETLMDYDEGEVPRPEELPEEGSSSTSPRSAPQRASSFRGNRSSPNSPLFSSQYQPSHTLKPVPLPRISPPSNSKL